MLKRYYKDLSQWLKPGAVLLIFGPRRAGKTTLLKNYLKDSGLKYKLDSGDNIQTQHVFASQNFDQILDYAEGYDLIAIDEAQQIKGIGMALKILVDQMPDLKIIATGSSSFDLAQSVGETLTGRKVTLTLFPIAQIELAEDENRHELKSRLEASLIYGSYPNVLLAKTKEEKIDILRELVDSYLLKDILALEKIKSSETLCKLVRLLAFQIGQLVSHHALATQLGINVKTVARYLDLLEKSFVIRKLGGYANNLRKTVTTKHKYYFCDLGVRNALIAQFSPLEMRNDVGQLWENFIFIERLKKQTYERFHGNRYFWRTYAGQEVDFVEEIDGHLHGFEAKWSLKKAVAAPKDWHGSFETIKPKNYLDYII